MAEEIEVPVEHLHKTIEEEAERGSENWMMRIALSSAIIAVLAAVCALLAGHYANESMITQLKANDSWSYYQAKGIKTSVLQSKIELLNALGQKSNPDDEKKLEKYQDEQKEIQGEAKKNENESKLFLERHNNLARGVTFFQIAIAIGAVAALTKRRWLWYGGLVISSGGIIYLIWGLI